MLRRIMIGIDSTRSSAAALHLGMIWAKQTGATLVGVGVVDEPGIRAIEPAWPVGGKPGSDPVYYMGYEPRLAAVQAQVQLALDQFAARCDEEGVAHTVTKRVGSPHEQLCAEASSCDIVVIGRGSQFRFIAGDDEADDTLKHLLKDACRPVVVVPSLVVADGPIVIAFDASLQANHALSAFLTTGLGESQAVHIFSVGPNAIVTAEHIKVACAILSEHGIAAVPHALVTPESPSQVILNEASERNASLLVMGAYGPPSLREFFLGSVTEKVLEEAQVPLFLTQ